MAIQRGNFAVYFCLFLGVWGCNAASLPSSSVAAYQPLARPPKVMYILDQTHASLHSDKTAEDDASRRSSNVSISDVLDAATGLSVMGEDAPLALTGDMTGKKIVLRILGSGFTWPEHFPDIAARYAVPIPSGFFAATFVGQQPYSVLLSDTIPLQPVAGGAFSSTELTMELDTRALVDSQMAGVHTLTVTSGNQKAQAPIRFGQPENSMGLAPKISTVAVVDAEDDDTWLLEVTGSNLPLDFRKVWVQLNGNERLFYHATFISEHESIGYIHVNKTAVKGAGENTLLLADPFGVAMASF